MRRVLMAAHIKSGTLKAGRGGAARNAALPEVPTLGELGFPM